MDDVGCWYVRVVGVVGGSLLEAEISRVVQCRSVCNSVVVKVSAGSLVVYRSGERGLLRLNRVLVLWTEWTNGEMVAKVCQALAFRAKVVRADRDDSLGFSRQSCAVAKGFRAKAVR